MKSRTKTALGIDIGDRSISAALVEKAGQGFRIVAAASVGLEENESGTESSSQEKTLGRVLRKLGRRARTRGTKSAVSASTRSMMVRLLDLPKQMPANLRDFVDGELRQYVALSGREVTSDFCGVGTGSGARKRLLAAAADAGEMGEIIETCRAAGVAADCVEPAVLACARAFLMSVKTMQHGGNAVLAVLNGSSLAVCLFNKGVLDFVRSRDIPAGMGTPQLLCAWLAEELRVVLRYCDADVPRESSPWQTRLVIHDAPCSKGELAPLLAHENGLASLAVVDSCEGVESSPASGSSRGASMMAVGAALRLLDMEGDRLRVDLMPQEVVSCPIVLSTRADPGQCGRGPFSRGLPGRPTAGEDGRCDEPADRTDPRGRADRHHARAGRPGPVSRRGDRRAMQRLLAGLEVVCARHEMDWPAVLSKIGQSAPAGACVTSLTCSDGQSLSVKGVAVSAEEANTFVQGLAGREPFESVRLTRIQRLRADADVVEYEVNCVLRPVNQEGDGGDRS